MPKKDKKAKKDSRPSYKGVTKRLRAFLTDHEATIPEMIAALDVTEEAVLYALRRLGKSKKGTLSSGMIEGRPCWWLTTEHQGYPHRGQRAPAQRTTEHRRSRSAGR